MHEMSIAQSLVSIIEQEMQKHGVTRLKKAVLRHGRLAGVVPDALSFAWDAVTPGTPLEGAELVMEEVPLVVRCRSCRLEFEPKETHVILAVCPGCGEEVGHEIVSGKEMHLQSIEAE
jgi:hydrogenase nickel incorporation protein HypA/HybF